MKRNNPWHIKVRSCIQYYLTKDSKLAYQKSWKYRENPKYFRKDLYVEGPNGLFAV